MCNCRSRSVERDTLACKPWRLATNHQPTTCTKGYPTNMIQTPKHDTVTKQTPQHNIISLNTYYPDVTNPILNQISQLLWITPPPPPPHTPTCNSPRVMQVRDRQGKKNTTCNLTTVGVHVSGVFTQRTHKSILSHWTSQQTEVFYSAAGNAKYIFWKITRATSHSPHTHDPYISPTMRHHIRGHYSVLSRGVYRYGKSYRYAYLYRIVVPVFCTGIPCCCWS